MTVRPRTISPWRLLVRSLRHHRGQTAAVVLMSALITAGAVFVPWYTGLVEDSTTRTAFAPAEGGTLRITAPGNVELEGLVPEGARDLFETPVGGRHADLEWAATNRDKPVQGGLMARDDVCAHVELVAGRCPGEVDVTGGGRTSEGAVPVVVSAEDAERYRVSVGDTVPEVSSTIDPVQLTVVGVYRLLDPDDPYWFGVLPTGRSGWTGPMLDVPVADLFLTTRDGVTTGSDRVFQDSLDLRVDAADVTAAAVPALRAALADLRAATEGTPAGLVTSMDDTFALLDDAWQVSATTMLVTSAQTGVLALAVLAMLVSVALIQRRPELGLSRLRGRGARSLVGVLAGQWAVVVGLGAVLGAGIGCLAVVAARALWLPTSPPLAPPLGALWAVLASVVAAVALLALLARPVVREPVPALLRATGPRTGAGGNRTLIDVALVTAAGCGLAVGMQSEEDSALALLAPSLLAVAASVLLVRLLTWASGRLARRWLGRGHTTRLLAAVLLARGRGTRLLLAVLCMAAAFVVFGTQFGAVADANRTHRAEVEAGADAVARTGVPPARLTAALDAVDPDRERATVVVTTAASDADGLGVVYVEPDAFQRIAYGAPDAAGAAEWERVTAASDTRPELVGRSLAVTVAPHRMQVGPEPTEITISVDYEHADGFLATARLGTVAADDRNARRLTAALQCAEPCRLLRWRFDPSAEVKGRLGLRDARTVGADGTGVPVEDGGAHAWPVPDDLGVDASVAVDPGRLLLTGSSGGVPIAAQHPSVPERMPVLLARAHPPAAENTNPAVVSPEGLALPVELVGTLDEAVPRLIGGVVVADVESILRRGEYRLTGRSEVQLWYAQGTDRAALDAELAEHGVRVTTVDTAAAHLEEHASSAESLTTEVVVPAAVVALLLAALALAVSVAATWRSATRDLAALRMVGLGRAALVRATCGVYLTIVVAATLTGVVCGLVGFTLAIKRTPIFTTPQPEIPLDLAPHLLPGLLALGLLLGVLGAAAVLCGRWLVGRSALERIREAGE